VTDEPDGADMRDALNAAIAEVVREKEHGLVTKWVALVESIDEDGERGMWTCASDGIKRWESMGMLRYALTLDEAHAARADMDE
jgi:hypothetical protein